MFFSNPSKQNSRVTAAPSSSPLLLLPLCCGWLPSPCQSSNTVAACCCLLRHCISSPFLICQCNKPQGMFIFPTSFLFFFPPSILCLQVLLFFYSSHSPLLLLSLISHYPRVWFQFFSFFFLPFYFSSSSLLPAINQKARPLPSDP